MWGTRRRRRTAALFGPEPPSLGTAAAIPYRRLARASRANRNTVSPSVTEIPPLVRDLTLGCVDLKRELVSEQTKWEISELNSPTALQRFGAPFKSEFGEVSPLDSDLPILRYIFVHHVREFPFLDKAREKEFWQDKLQVVSRGRLFSMSCSRSVNTALVEIVPRVLCEQEHLVLGGSPRGDEAQEVGHEGPETGRADDGVGRSHLFRV